MLLMAAEQYHLRVLVSSKYFLTLVTYSFYAWYFSLGLAINLDGKQTVPKLFLGFFFPNYTSKSVWFYI